MTELKEEEEYELDEVRGAHGRKPKMAVLNKNRCSKDDLDSLFLEEDMVYINRQRFRTGTSNTILDD